MVHASTIHSISCLETKPIFLPLLVSIYEGAFLIHLGLLVAATDPAAAFLDYLLINVYVNLYLGGNLVVKLIAFLSVLVISGCATIEHGSSDVDLIINSDVEGLAYFIPKGIYKEVGQDKGGFYYEAGRVVPKLLSPEAAFIYAKKDPAYQSLCVQLHSGKRYCYKADFERKPI
jgi:hypothetical protein